MDVRAGFYRRNTKLETNDLANSKSEGSEKSLVTEVKEEFIGLLRLGSNIQTQQMKQLACKLTSLLFH